MYKVSRSLTAFKLALVCILLCSVPYCLCNGKLSFSEARELFENDNFKFAKRPTDTITKYNSYPSWFPSTSSNLATFKGLAEKLTINDNTSSQTANYIRRSQCAKVVEMPERFAAVNLTGFANERDSLLVVFRVNLKTKDLNLESSSNGRFFPSSTLMELKYDRLTEYFNGTTVIKRNLRYPFFLRPKHRDVQGGLADMASKAVLPIPWTCLGEDSYECIWLLQVDSQIGLTASNDMIPLWHLWVFSPSRSGDFSKAEPHLVGAGAFSSPKEDYGYHNNVLLYDHQRQDAFMKSNLAKHYTMYARWNSLEFGMFNGRLLGGVMDEQSYESVFISSSSEPFRLVFNAHYENKYRLFHRFARLRYVSDSSAPSFSSRYELSSLLDPREHAVFQSLLLDFKPEYSRTVERYTQCLRESLEDDVHFAEDKSAVLEELEEMLQDCKNDKRLEELILGLFYLSYR